MIRRLALLLWLVAGPLAAADAEHWLARVGPALRELDYQGTLVYVSGTRVETLRVFHSFEKGRERERLLALTGRPREVIRDGDRVICLGADAATTVFDGPDAGRWSPAAALLGASALTGYAPRLGATARVAGRVVQMVEVAATDAWRYGSRLWLDHETGLPLRTATLDAEGVVVEQLAFTDVEIGKRPDDADLQASLPAPRQNPLPTKPRAGEDPGWRVASPPPGFTLRAARRLTRGIQLLYGDGLASISVYIEPVAAGAQGESATRHGAVHARAFWRDGWRVVAIGKVPAATVERFARTVQAPVAADG